MAGCSKIFGNRCVLSIFYLFFKVLTISFLIDFFKKFGSMQDISSLTSKQTHPLYWEHRIFTTEPPGKSLPLSF